MTANAMALTRRSWLAESTGAIEASMSISGRSSKQAGRPDQEDNRHDDEHHRVRRLRIEDLGQTFDDAEHEAGYDRAHDRSHAADHHDCEHHGDDVGPHARTDLIDRRGEHAGESRERNPEAI